MQAINIDLSDPVGAIKQIRIPPVHDETSLDNIYSVLVLLLKLRSLIYLYEGKIGRKNRNDRKLVMFALDYHQLKTVKLGVPMYLAALKYRRKCVSIRKIYLHR
jgi:hypothetical protein